ncbi:BspA family leucine-rich repeat surface protein [Listeria monocytogenes]|nr:BspA family leucine-rich repeat surface protein [Listeria monocytogenes]
MDLKLNKRKKTFDKLVVALLVMNMLGLPIQNIVLANELSTTEEVVTEETKINESATAVTNTSNSESMESETAPISEKESELTEISSSETTLEESKVLTDTSDVKSSEKQESSEEPSARTQQSEERTSTKAVTTGTFPNGSTSAWTFDDTSGELSISAGTLVNPNQSLGALIGVSANSIKNIVFEGQVVASGSLFRLFYGASDLTSLDLSNLDTKQVTSMSQMFYGASGLTSLNLSNLDTRQVMNMSQMFREATSLTSLNLNNFHTNRVTNMTSMFYRATSLTSLDVTSFDTSQVTDMTSMFNGTINLTSLDVSSFDTGKVTNISYMFNGAWSLTSLDLSNFDTRQVTNMSFMFDGSAVTSLDLSNFDTSKVADMQAMFRGTSKLQNLTLGSQFQFVGTDANLSNPTPTANYTGKWQNVGSGTVNKPKGSFIGTATELMSTYDGSTMADTYVWQPILLEVNVQDSILMVGDTWNPEDNFLSALDSVGDPVDFKDITVTGSVDTTQPGAYKVDYSYDGVTSTATITVLAPVVVNVKDSTLIQGDTWNASDNFLDATDSTGNPVSFQDITVTGSVDTTQPGVYKVDYSYDGITSTATITVLAPVVVNVKDSTLIQGDTWNASDNFLDATDDAGNPVSFQDITVTGSVDTTQPGVYKVDYSYDGTTSTATITVLAPVVVNVKDSTLMQGDTWNASDNFLGATDATGAPVAFQDITVTGSVDTTQPGVYKVDYSYDGVTSTATITVLAPVVVNVKNSTLMQGDTWNASDNFLDATDDAGNPVSFQDITVTGSVDTTQPGVYKVDYSYDGTTSTATITVLAPVVVNVKDSTLMQGDTWNASDNFLDATDDTGAPVSFQDITVTGSVDTTQPGVYKVDYSYDGTTSTATITVLAPVVVNVKDSTLMQGDTWNASDNFLDATDDAGNPVSFQNITVTGSVDTTQPSVYKVDYSYDGTTSTATITVLETMPESWINFIVDGTNVRAIPGSLLSKAEWDLTTGLWAGWNPGTIKVPTDKLPSAPVKEGYTFKGWQDTTGTIVDFSTLEIDLNSTTEFNFTAGYEKNTYNVTFNVDGRQEQQTVLFDELISEPTTPTKDGYLFTGWYDSPTGGDKWDFSTDKMPAKNVELYAHFKELMVVTPGVDPVTPSVVKPITPEVDPVIPSVVKPITPGVDPVTPSVVKPIMPGVDPVTPSVNPPTTPGEGPNVVSPTTPGSGGNQPPSNGSGSNTGNTTTPSPTTSQRGKLAKLGENSSLLLQGFGLLLVLSGLILFWKKRKRTHL